MHVKGIPPDEEERSGNRPLSGLPVLLGAGPVRMGVLEVHFSGKTTRAIICHRQDFVSTFVK